MIIANSTLLIQRMFPVEKYSLNEKAIAMVKAVMMLFFNICFPPFCARAVVCAAQQSALPN